MEEKLCKSLNNLLAEQSEVICGSTDKVRHVSSINNNALLAVEFWIASIIREDWGEKLSEISERNREEEKARILEAGMSLSSFGIFVRGLNKARKHTFSCEP